MSNSNNNNNNNNLNLTLNLDTDVCYYTRAKVNIIVCETIQTFPYILINILLDYSCPDYRVDEDAPYSFSEAHNMGPYKAGIENEDYDLRLLQVFRYQMHSNYDQNVIIFEKTYDMMHFIRHQMPHALIELQIKTRKENNKKQVRVLYIAKNAECKCLFKKCYNEFVKNLSEPWLLKKDENAKQFIIEWTQADKIQKNQIYDLIVYPYIKNKQNIPTNMSMKFIGCYELEGYRDRFGRPRDRVSIAVTLTNIQEDLYIPILDDSKTGNCTIIPYNNKKITNVTLK
jgi:hypothetical protein